MPWSFSSYKAFWFSYGSFQLWAPTLIIGSVLCASFALVNYAAAVNERRHQLKHRSESDDGTDLQPDIDLDNLDFSNVTVSKLLIHPIKVW